jgi:hypothetical protein
MQWIHDDEGSVEVNDIKISVQDRKRLLTELNVTNSMLRSVYLF